jgi:type IV secretion system protein VirD4
MAAPRPATASETRSRLGHSGERGLYLGRFVDEEAGVLGDKLIYEGERHALLFGPTGCGKGTRFLTVNLLGNYLAGRSVIVLDPKGELAAICAMARHKMHGPGSVKILDPFGKLEEAVGRSADHEYLKKHGLIESTGFNPLAALNAGTRDKPNLNFYDDAAALGEALIQIDKKEPHWTESAQGLVTAMVMWEAVREKNPGEVASLENVRRMLTQGDTSETLDGVRYATGGLTVTARQMVAEGGYQIASLAGRFTEQRNELASIRSAADTQTRWLLSERIRADLKKPGIDFRKLKGTPQTVFVILPAERMRTHSVWLRLVIVSALRALYRPGGLRTVMLIDEMAALGHLAPLEDAFGLVRGYGLQIVGILQDMAQLKNLYAERWESFVANAGVVMGFPPNDKTTSEWMSWRSGQTTIVVRSVSGGTGTSGETESHSTIGRNYYLEHDLMGLYEGSGVLWVAGLAHTVRFFADKYSELAVYASRALPSPYYPMANQSSP